MKKVMFLMLLISNFPVFAQKEVKEDEKGKVEMFSSRKGSILEKESFTVATIKSVVGIVTLNYPVEVLKIKDLQKNDSLYCLRMMAKTESGTSVIGYINADEMDNVISFLQMVANKYLIFPPPMNDFEIEYISDSGFQIVVFKFKNNWMISLHPKSYATISLEKDAMPFIITAFKKAKEAMK